MITSAYIRVIKINISSHANTAVHLRYSRDISVLPQFLSNYMGLLY